MKAKSLYIALLGLIAIIVLAGGFGYYVSHARLADKISQLETTSAEIAATREARSDLQSLEAAYQEARPLEEQAADILPEEKRQSEVTARIFQMIESAGLSSDAISFQSTDGVPDRTTQTDSGPLNNVLAMPANFTVQGTYPELLLFLENVERQQRLMQVTALDISRSEEGEQLSFRVQLEVFLKS